LKSSSLSGGVDAEAGGESGEAGEHLPRPEERGDLQVIHQEHQSQPCIISFNIGGQCHSFYLFLFHRLVMRRVHFSYSVLLGGCLVEWMRSGLEAYLF
jgi:hypothetical protein